MLYVFIELYESQYLEDIYLALQSIGVQQAIAVDAKNISAALSDEQTFFSGFFRSDRLESDTVTVIQAQVDEPEQVREFIENLREGGVEIDSHPIMRVSAVPAVFTFSYENGVGKLQDH